MRYDAGLSRGLGGPRTPGPFRGRSRRRYDSYFRRDFLTNQGDFSDRFGGGPDYGYRGGPAGRVGPPRRGMEYGPGQGWSVGRGPYGGARGGLGPRSYGPRFGTRYETTDAYDVAYRNFRR